MADKYIDGQLASGTQSGDDWTNAYYTEANIQGAYDQLAAGDTLHCTRTQTLTAPIDIDQATGTIGNPITVLGYNYNAGAPVVDGARYVIDANSAAANCINIADKDYWHFKNVEFKNATGDNVAGSVSTPQLCVFKNCISHDSGGRGWGGVGGVYFYRTTFVLCQAYNNSLDGIRAEEQSIFLFCTAYGNGGVGAYSGFTAKSSVYAVCVSYGNADKNFYDTRTQPFFFGCVSDDPTAGGIAVDYSTAVIAACRITGTGTGIVGDGSVDVLDLWNFINTSTKTATATVDQQVRGANTRIETGVEGYIDAAGGNYGLINAAVARRQEVTL